MSERTTVFMNTTPVIPFVLFQQAARGKGDGKYPSQEELEQHIRGVTQKLLAFDATDLARSAGMVKTLNVVMVGCLLGSGILPATPEEFTETVMKSVPSNLAAANDRAFQTGVEYGKTLRKPEETS